MTAEELFTTLTHAGCRLIPDGKRLRIQDPRQALTDDLRAAIRQHKPALLARLVLPPQEQQTPAPVEHVGRQGAPCPVCSDTWQWPTTSGLWVCSWCFVQGPRTAPWFADDGALMHGSTKG
jgi:hypothetical protein